jgi:hypothetical protein
MFCCKCGARNPEDAGFCHKCGASLYKEEARLMGGTTKNENLRQVGTPSPEEQRQLIDELLPIDQKPHECHACGRADNLYAWDFGLGKKISTKRAWGETAWSVAVSAVTIPLFGAGGLQFPGKKARLRVLRLRLILCDSCRQGQIKYNLHPWWEPARRLGYMEFLSTEELKKLQPAKGR